MCVLRVLFSCAFFVLASIFVCCVLRSCNCEELLLAFFETSCPIGDFLCANECTLSVRVGTMLEQAVLHVMISCGQQSLDFFLPKCLAKIFSDSKRFVLAWFFFGFLCFRFDVWVRRCDTKFRTKSFRIEIELCILCCYCMVSGPGISNFFHFDSSALMSVKKIKFL